MTQHMVLRKIMRLRGYLVLWQAHWQPQLAVGQILSSVGGERFNFGKSFKVVAKTSDRDFLVQQRLSRKLEPLYWKSGSPAAVLQKATIQYGPLSFWRVKKTKMKTKWIGLLRVRGEKEL